MKELTRLINEERHEAEFALSVKATLVVGRQDSFSLTKTTCRDLSALPSRSHPGLL